jgi:hypothetical protein
VREERKEDCSSQILCRGIYLERRKWKRTQAPKNVSPGVCQSLPLFSGHTLSQRPHVLIDQLLQLEHNAGTLRYRRGAPGGEGVFGGAHGGVELGGCGPWQAGYNLLGGRVVDIDPGRCCALYQLAFDQQFDCGSLRRQHRIGSA